MGRPKTSPGLRYSDVLPILDQALYNDGVKYPAHDERHAVHLVWRMNRCRKEIRESNEEGECIYDKFVIRASGNYVLVQPRFIPDVSQMRKLDGSPLEKEFTPEEAKKIIEEEIRKMQEKKPLGLLDE